MKETKEIRFVNCGYCNDTTTATIENENAICDICQSDLGEM